MIQQEDILRVAKRIGDSTHAERVILFGSHARGQASAHSDVDLADIELSKQWVAKAGNDLLNADNNLFRTGCSRSSERCR